MEARTLTIRIGGDEGEGVLLCGRMLAEALTRSGHLVLAHLAGPQAPNAPESVLLRAGGEPLASLRESVDVLFAWSQEAYDRYRDALWPEGLLLYDPDRVRAREEDAPIRHGVPLSRLAARQELTGKPDVAAGVLARILGLPRDAGLANPRAFEAGYEHARRPPLGVVRFDLDQGAVAPRSVVAGAASAARGFADAGVREAACVGFAADAPFARALEEVGIVVHREPSGERAVERARAAAGRVSLVVQGEGMAGFRPLCARVEGAPIALVGLVRRTGAGGGVPAGSRLVFAPAAVEECGTLARLAGELCARYSAPVAYYLDGVLESLLASIASDAGGTAVVVPEAPPDEVGRALAARWTEEHLPHGARIGVVSCGAALGAIRDARAECEEGGLPVANLHARVLAPAPDEALRRFLPTLERVLVVEPESAGPLGELLEERYGVTPERLAVAPPVTPEAVQRAIAAR